MVDAAGEPVRSPRSSHKAAIAKRQLRADRAAGREAWAEEKRRSGLAQPEDDEDENENDDEDEDENDDEDEDENENENDDENEDENDAMDEDEDKDENDAMDEDENEDEVVKKLDKVRAQRGSLGP